MSEKGVSACGRCACASLVAQRQGPSESIANKKKRTFEMDPRTTLLSDIIAGYG